MELKGLLSFLMVLFHGSSTPAASTATPSPTTPTLPTLTPTCTTAGSCGIKGAVFTSPTPISTQLAMSAASCQALCASNTKCLSFAYNDGADSELKCLLYGVIGKTYVNVFPSADAVPYLVYDEACFSPCLLSSSSSTHSSSTSRSTTTSIASTTSHTSTATSHSPSLPSTATSHTSTAASHTSSTEASHMSSATSHTSTTETSHTSTATFHTTTATSATSHVSTATSHTSSTETSHTSTATSATSHVSTATSHTSSIETSYTSTATSATSVTSHTSTATTTSHASSTSSPSPATSARSSGTSSQATTTSTSTSSQSSTTSTSTTTSVSGPLPTFLIGVLSTSQTALRRRSVSYLTLEGLLTEEIAEAAAYFIDELGQLGTSAGYVSTSLVTGYALLAPSSSIGTYTETFSITEEGIAWTNGAFGIGTTVFYQVNETLVALFGGAAPVGGAPVALTSVPTSLQTASPTPSSTTTAVLTSTIASSATSVFTSVSSVTSGSTTSSSSTSAGYGTPAPPTSTFNTLPTSMTPSSSTTTITISSLSSLTTLSILTTTVSTAMAPSTTSTSGTTSTSSSISSMTVKPSSLSSSPTLATCTSVSNVASGIACQESGLTPNITPFEVIPLPAPTSYNPNAFTDAIDTCAAYCLEYGCASWSYFTDGCELYSLSVLALYTGSQNIDGPREGAFAYDAGCFACTGGSAAVQPPASSSPMASSPLSSSSSQIASATSQTSIFASVSSSVIITMTTTTTNQPPTSLLIYTSSTTTGPAVSSVSCTTNPTATSLPGSTCGTSGLAFSVQPDLTIAIPKSATSNQAGVLPLCAGYCQELGFGSFTLLGNTCSFYNTTIANLPVTGTSTAAIAYDSVCFSCPSLNALAGSLAPLSSTATSTLGTILSTTTTVDAPSYGSGAPGSYESSPPTISCTYVPDPVCTLTGISPTVQPEIFEYVNDVDECANYANGFPTLSFEASNGVCQVWPEDLDTLYDESYVNEALYTAVFYSLDCFVCFGYSEPSSVPSTVITSSSSTATSSPTPSTALGGTTCVAAPPSSTEELGCDISNLAPGAGYPGPFYTATVANLDACAAACYQEAGSSFSWNAITELCSSYFDAFSELYQLMDSGVPDDTAYYDIGCFQCSDSGSTTTTTLPSTPVSSPVYGYSTVPTYASTSPAKNLSTTTVALMSSSLTQKSAPTTTATSSITAPIACTSQSAKNGGVCGVYGLDVTIPYFYAESNVTTLIDCYVVCFQMSCVTFWYYEDVCALYSQNYATLSNGATIDQTTFKEPFFSSDCFVCTGLTRLTSSIATTSPTATISSASPTLNSTRGLSTATSITLSGTSITTSSAAATSSAALDCSGFANGDFETGSLSPWVQATTGGSASVVDNDCYSGDYCLVVSNSAWETTVNAQYVTTTIGETYTFSAWSRVSAADMSVCTVLYQFNINNTGPGFITVASVPNYPDLDWIQSTASYTATTAGFLLYVEVACSAPLNTVPDFYFDDFSLVGAGCPAFAAASVNLGPPSSTSIPTTASGVQQKTTQASTPTTTLTASSATGISFASCYGSLSCGELDISPAEAEGGSFSSGGYQTFESCATLCLQAGSCGYDASEEVCYLFLDNVEQLSAYTYGPSNGTSSEIVMYDSGCFQCAGQNIGTATSGVIPSTASTTFKTLNSVALPPSATSIVIPPSAGYTTPATSASTATSSSTSTTPQTPTSTTTSMTSATSTTSTTTTSSASTPTATARNCAAITTNTLASAEGWSCDAFDMGSNFDDAYARYASATEFQCVTDCLEDPNCVSFAYATSYELCALFGEPISYYEAMDAGLVVMVTGLMGWDEDCFLCVQD